MRPSTRVVFLESPGSWTFEMQDIPAFARDAHRGGATVIMNNTWATPLLFKPLSHGVDVSIHAATKYMIYHSDALLGVATANKSAWAALREGCHDFGQTAGLDDIFLALRGMRTMDVRMQSHWENGVLLADSLRQHALMKRRLHPALPSDPGHAPWKRAYTGSSGLFSMVLKTGERKIIEVIVDRLQLFGIGLSWGCCESLVLPCEPEIARSVRPCPHNGRISIFQIRYEPEPCVIR
jgi:cystathionine beta-lyase